MVGEAATIPEAEAQVRACTPDLAVVDLILPGVYGMEGIERLKAVRPNLRVIVVSVIDNHVDLIRTAAARAGAEDFLPKEELSVEAVQSWLA